MFSTNADNIGRIGFGAAVSGNAIYYFAGTMSHRWTGADGRGTWFNTSHTPNDARSGEIVRISGAITEISSGTHPWFRGLGLFAPTITTAGGSVTNSATLYIDGAMSNATNNYSVYVAGGNSYFAGSITSGTHISVGTSIDMPNGGSINCGDSGSGAVSYTHLTLPTILLV